MFVYEKLLIIRVHWRQRLVHLVILTDFMAYKRTDETQITRNVSSKRSEVIVELSGPNVMDKFQSRSMRSTMITVMADMDTPFLVSITSRNLFNLSLRFMNMMNLVNCRLLLLLLLFLTSILTRIQLSQFAHFRLGVKHFSEGCKILKTGVKLTCRLFLKGFR